MDENIALFFWNLRDTLLFDIFKIISGKVYIVVTLLLFTCYGAVKLKKQFIRFFLVCILALTVSDMICYRVLKPAFNRLRPVYELKLTEEKVPDSRKKYSMPSNHASNIFSFFTVYILFIKRFRLLLLFNSIAIACSRFIIVKHYLTDVVAGIVIGSIIGMIFTCLFSIIYKYFTQVEWFF